MNMNTMAQAAHDEEVRAAAKEIGRARRSIVDQVQVEVVATTVTRQTENHGPRHPMGAQGSEGGGLRGIAKNLEERRVKNE